MSALLPSYANPWKGVQDRPYRNSLKLFVIGGALGFIGSMLILAGAIWQLYNGLTPTQDHGNAALAVLVSGVALIGALSLYKALFEAKVDDYSDRASAQVNVGLWENVEGLVQEKYGKGTLNPYDGPRDQVFPPTGEAGFWGWVDRKFFGTRTPVMWQAEEGEAQKMYLSVKPKSFEPTMITASEDKVEGRGHDSAEEGEEKV